MDNNKEENAKHEIKIPDTIYDERNAKKINKQKREKQRENIKENAKIITTFSKDYYRIFRKIFSSNREANEIIKEIFNANDKKHYYFIWILLMLFTIIPFINLLKAGLIELLNWNINFINGNSAFFFPCFIYFCGLILYLIIISMILFLLELIFSKRSLKMKDILNLINIKSIIMIFYTVLIIIITIIKPIENSWLYLVSSALMLISLSTSDALMIRIGRKTGLIRETNNLYMIILNTLLSIAMFIAYYVFLLYL